MDIPSVTGLLFMKLESERVPRKNLRDVGGRPLFQWILETLESSDYVDRVVLNTDSELIAEAVTADFDVIIHMRPDHLLQVQSNEANQIIQHDLHSAPGDFFIQTHSTNPLLSKETLDRGIEAFFGEVLPRGFDSLVSVTAHQKRFYHADGSPVNHDPRRLQKTQELEPLLEENSCVYMFSRESFSASGGNRIGLRPFLWPMPALEAVDIDTEEDLHLTDRLLRARRSADIG